MPTPINKGKIKRVGPVPTEKITQAKRPSYDPTPDEESGAPVGETESGGERLTNYKHGGKVRGHGIERKGKTKGKFK